MHAVYPVDLPHLLDDFNANLQAFLALPGRWGLAQPLDNCVRNVDTGNIGAHPFRRFCGSQRSYPDEDKYLLVQPQIANAPHESLKEGSIKAVLRLDKISPGG